MHPLVLLSVVDHYNRVARDTRKRVVGVLLGEASKGSIQVTNAFGGALRRVKSLPRTACDISWALQQVMFAVQSLSRRTTGTHRYGTWTTAMWKAWLECSGGWQVCAPSL